MFNSIKRSFLPGMFFIIPVLMVFIIANTQAYATDLGDDFSSNSVIELSEAAYGGDYRNKTIKITTLNGKTTVAVITDGNKVESEMPYEACEVLWSYLIEKDAGYLEDAIGGAFPDSSTFTLKVSAGVNSHTVKVEGIDTMRNTRSRDIAREIIRVSELYVPRNTK